MQAPIENVKLFVIFTSFIMSENILQSNNMKVVKKPKYSISAFITSTQPKKMHFKLWIIILCLLALVYLQGYNNTTKSKLTKDDPALEIIQSSKLEKSTHIYNIYKYPQIPNPWVYMIISILKILTNS